MVSGLMRTLTFLFSILSIIGSLMLLNYLDKLSKVEGCVEIAPKQADFIHKYALLILISSLATIIFSWFKMI